MPAPALLIAAVLASSSAAHPFQPEPAPPAPVAPAATPPAPKEPTPGAGAKDGAPKPQKPALAPAPTPAEDPELAAVPTRSVLIGDDPLKEYELIGPRVGATQPEGGWRLLVVLPGGDGSGEFNPFLRRVALNALAETYLLAQVVAPQWRTDKNRVVWPTARLPDDKMKFATEQLVREVIEDARSRHTINAAHIYLMGWSSGGPPVYTCLAMPDMPVTGGFVAMSVFKPEALPDLAGAKGRTVYILHSPQDFIKMRFPEAAVEQLKAAGAQVKLQTYEGGHGWRGDVFGNIRRGIEWLEQQAPAPKK